MDVPQSKISIKSFSKLRKATVKPSQTQKKTPTVIVLKREVLTTKKAVELLVNGTLKRKICRYCLHITAPLSELDQIMQIADRGVLYKVTIRDIVASFHPFKVSSDTDFPNKICEKCLNKALQAYRFAQQCEQTERALKNCFEDVLTKMEKLDPLESVPKRGKHKLHPNHNVLVIEHRNVIDYAEPIRNLINVSTVSLTNEPVMSNLECKKCWQVLPNIESLVNHEKIHPKSMWFNCRFCGKSFAKKLHIKRHLAIHAEETKQNQKLGEKETNFVCKQCGHSTDNHDLHLQHIEKHKFQTVLEHVVEKKMDELCSVCFSDNRKMVAMDKTVCLHGGYPELTGDRSLYNILGATVPECNYKYQELYVAHETKLMTITRKINTKSAEKNKSNSKIYTFKLSLPIIVSLERKKYSDTDVFTFSDPQLINLENLTSEDKLFNHVNNERAYYTEKAIVTKTLDDDTTQTCLNNNALMTNFDNNEKMQFAFSKPEYVEVDKNPKVIEKEYTEVNNTQPHTNKKTIICGKCWIFKNSECKTCTGNKQLNSREDTINELMEIDTTVKISEINAKGNPCQYCWVFKHALKCDFCKQATLTVNMPEIETESEKIESKCVTEINNENSQDTKAAVKRNIPIMNTEFLSTGKKFKWQCNICLTTNNFDRDTCVCCESEKGHDANINHNLNYNFVKFTKSTTPDCEKNIDINQNDINFELTAEITNDNKLPITVNEEQNENTVKPALEMMELSNGPSDFSKYDIPDPTTLDETMEIATEEETEPLFGTVSTVYQQITPIILPRGETESLAPVNIHRNNIPAFLPNPFSSGTASTDVNSPETSQNIHVNNLQFNIGAMFKEDKMNNMKNFNRNLKLKKLKALHK